MIINVCNRKAVGVGVWRLKNSQGLLITCLAPGTMRDCFQDIRHNVTEQDTQCFPLASTCEYTYTLMCSQVVLFSFSCLFWMEMQEVEWFLVCSTCFFILGFRQKK